MRLRIAAIALATGFATGATSAMPAPDGGNAYFVFFNWGAVDVSSDWSSNIDEAVAAYQASPAGTLVRVTGYSDRSGPVDVNRRIAERRARAVAMVLVERGIPESAVRVSSSGERESLILTEDGVREAQNRRVEIILEPQ